MSGINPGGGANGLCWIVFIDGIRGGRGGSDEWAGDFGFAAVIGAKEVKSEFGIGPIEVGLNENPAAGVIAEFEVRRWGVDGGIEAGRKTALLIETDAIGVSGAVDDRKSGIKDSAIESGGNLADAAAIIKNGFAFFNGIGLLEAENG